MSDPQQAWPHYYNDPHQFRCVDDPAVIHEGDEVDDCESCTPPECPDCSPGSMPHSECLACSDDRRFHEDRDRRCEERP